MNKNAVPESNALTHTLPHEPVPGADLPKPPTQGVGVQGFVAFEAKPAEPIAPAEWTKLVQLPPFQMFAAEKSPNISDADSMAHAIVYVQANGGGADIAQAYAKWHAEKGYWPNETPMGELKNA